MLGYGLYSATRRRRAILLGTLVVLASVAVPVRAVAQFSVNGRTVSPAERNFAGVRQVTPRYGLVVQINHDVQRPGDFELSLVDEIYAELLQRYRRSPVIRADAVPSSSALRPRSRGSAKAVGGACSASSSPS